MTDVAQEVSARVRQMAKDANDLILLLDQQTYDEYRRGDWDLPDDCELLVTFTAGDLRKLDRILHAYLRACQTGVSTLDAIATDVQTYPRSPIEKGDAP